MHLPSGVELAGKLLRSQSPLTGQFNFYKCTTSKCPSYTLPYVSIPSNGSIQFLSEPFPVLSSIGANVSIPSNGSIQFLSQCWRCMKSMADWSQSPLTGQFNFYLSRYYLINLFSVSQSPLTGQFNFYPKQTQQTKPVRRTSLNPL